jgi:hypothetical protein
MNIIEFNDLELSEMKQFYLAQLVEAENKVAHLKGVLAKLGAPVAAAAPALPAPQPLIVEAVVESKPKQAVVEDEVKQAYISYIPVEYTKRGRGSKRKKERKSKWATYIVNTLRSKGEPMTTNEILEHAMRRTANQEAGEPSVRGGIASSLNRLSKEYFRLRTLNVDGRRGRYYGLAVWFNLDGTFKPGFGERFGKLNMTVRDAVDADTDED